MLAKRELKRRSDRADERWPNGGRSEGEQGRVGYWRLGGSPSMGISSSIVGSSQTSSRPSHRSSLLIVIWSQDRRISSLALSRISQPTPALLQSISSARPFSLPPSSPKTQLNLPRQRHPLHRIRHRQAPAPIHLCPRFGQIDDLDTPLV